MFPLYRIRHNYLFNWDGEGKSNGYIALRTCLLLFLLALGYLVAFMVHKPQEVWTMFCQQIETTANRNVFVKE